LNGRTGLPLARLLALRNLQDTALRRELDQIQRVAQRLTQVVGDGTFGTSAISGFLAGLDLSSISKDVGWRAIIGALCTFNSSVDEFKRAALQKYQHYLLARAQAVHLFLNYRAVTQGASRAQAGNTGAAGEESRATLVNDMAHQMANSDGAYERLPEGKAIDIALRSGDEVPLMLVNHHCKIVGRTGNLSSFIDARGKEVALRNGRTVVGRDSRSDICISCDRRDISRRHLIVERTPDNIIRLTDISSLGTFIPPSLPGQNRQLRLQ
jgi:hypothetical protein